MYICTSYEQSATHTITRHVDLETRTKYVVICVNASTSLYCIGKILCRINKCIVFCQQSAEEKKQEHKTGWTK